MVRSVCSRRPAEVWRTPPGLSTTRTCAWRREDQLRMCDEPTERVLSVLSPGNEPASRAERSLRARLAAYALHAQRDPRQTTANGRAAFLARFDREVDPE